MTSPSANANISEIDGAYWPVHLQFLPRVGEFIDLHSFIDVGTGHPPRHQFEVVAIVHELHDVSKKRPESEGHHFVTVHVRRSSNALLQK